MDEKKLRDIVRDFTLFAPDCLTIRTKSGSLAKLKLNRAQLYAHSRLEQQLKDIGKVRALVLKGRQQGLCCSKNMQVLTADYKWVKIDNVNIGDRLVACDEASSGKTKSGKNQARKFRTAIVEDKREFIKETFEILFDNGARLEVTGNHRMLCRKRGGCEPEWRTVDEFKIDDYVRIATRPPNYECQSYEDGWIGGIIDGEGSSRGDKGAKRLSLHQTPGEILSRMKSYFQRIDMPFKEVIDRRTKCGERNKLGDKPVHRIDIHRLPYLMELFARCRPTRFTNKEWHVGHELPGKSAQEGIKPWAKVISIKSLGKMKVIDLQTSTKTYIVEGLVSHNSTMIQARYFHKIITRMGTKAYILTHEAEATKNLFEMTKRYYDYLPRGLATKADRVSSKELVFEKYQSSYSVGTAGNPGAGRSSTIQLFHGCLAKGTKIIDPLKGDVKNIEDFNVGDMVKTHTNEIAPISFISKQTKECLFVKLRTITAFPLIATGEHKFWTKKGWKKLEDFKSDDVIGYPIKKITEKINYLFVPEPEIRKQGGGKQFICPDNININYEFGRIIGLYLAEGHIKLQSKHPFLPSYVLFTVHRKELKRTVKWLSYFHEFYSSIKTKNRENSLTSTVTIYGSRFARLINDLCGRTTNKHVPYDWHLMGESFCRGLLHGYISGDGSSYDTDRRVRASSICPAITIPLRDITASLGYGWASIEYKEAGTRHGRNEKERYTFSLCGNGAYQLALEIDKPSVPIKNRKTGSIERYAATTTEISEGYAWLRLISISYAGKHEVYDFEINHEDHSYCTIHGATHNSEVAHWPNADEHDKGALNAVSDEPGTEIILESTANGIGNYFYNMWQGAERGGSEYIAIFIPWYWQDEYTASDTGFNLTEEEDFLYNTHKNDGMTKRHLAWRRLKINKSRDKELATESFKQEYPSSSTEAFLNPIANVFINARHVVKARKQNIDNNSAEKLIIGVDVAVSDNDRTAIIRRKGRVAYNLQTHKNMNTMEIAGLLKNIIEKERPWKVYIDCIGVGAGVVDRLREQNFYFVEGINVARTANQKDKYRNLRAELWDNMKDWLIQEMPVQIPDDDTLHGDLCNLGYKYDSSGRLQIESKDELKARGMASPDTADALSLTFFSGFYESSQTTNPVTTVPVFRPGMFF